MSGLGTEENSRGILRSRGFHLVIIPLIFYFLNPFPVLGSSIHKRLQVGLVHDDNHTLEVKEGNRIGVWIKEIGLSIGSFRQVDRSNSYQLGLDLSNQQFSRYSAFGNTYGGLNFSWRVKPQLGPFSAWWKLTGRYGLKNFDESWQNLSIFDVGLAYGKRINDRASISVGFEFDSTKGRENGIFDGKGSSIRLNGDVALSNKLTFFAGTQYRSGDVVYYGDQYGKKSSSSPPTAYPSERSVGSAPSPAGRSSSTRATRAAAPQRIRVPFTIDRDDWSSGKKVLYKWTKARSTRVTLGLSQATSDTSSLNVSFERLETQKDNRLYTRDTIKIFYLQDF